jgi:ABC-2 type transport system ATP-binding protein
MRIIELTDLSKVYSLGLGQSNVVALQGLNLTIERGEVFGFLGPNGAGKTTTIKILVGLMHPTSGTARLFGKEVGTNGGEVLRAKIGFLPETPSFYGYLTGVELLTFYGKLFSLSTNEIKERIATLLKQVGLESAGNIPLRKYSKGMLQRVGIAQSLINDPELVILDEPMSGLDPIGRKEMRDLILRLKSEGKTLFFSSHIIHDVERVCDRVGILSKGRLLGLGKIDDVREAGETLEDAFVRMVRGADAL